jgi:hypothetical protein
MIMSRWLFAVGVGLLCGAAHAASVDTPALKAGDTWAYTQTIETGTQGWVRKDEQISVERVTSDSVMIALKLSGSDQPPVEELRGLDWSRSTDINGKQQVVSQPMAFPLSEGKKWDMSYTQEHPDALHTSQTVHCKYVATGWEDIQVPAGKYKALKIEGDGEWSAVLAPHAGVSAQGLAVPGGTATFTQSQRVAPRTISGRFYWAYWYVPALKRYVKSVEETYSTTGVRSKRITEELTSSQISG